MVTVFTPVYNRAYIIDQLYQSLLRQTNYDFEWLIVDDGSTDNIVELVNQWISCTREFEIRFYHQPNGGKHRAINRGVQLAQGDAFLIVDSDDFLTDDAIDTVLNYWEQIKDNEEFAGISGLRMNRNMQVNGGKPFFDEYVDATNMERAEYGLGGDKAEVYKTNILKSFPFPEFEGENFVPEISVWNKIAYQGFKLRWFNKGIIICEYLEDGLTAKGNKLLIQNPKGWALHLCTARVYWEWSEHFYLRQCFYYYVKEHMRINSNEMRELLEISSNDMNAIEKVYFHLKNRLVELCNDKKVCIYGYGAWGKYLRWFLDEMSISIEYIIDRKCLDTGEIVRYDPKSDLPEVDVVIVALKNGADDVIAMLKNKLKESEIVKLTEIAGEWWWVIWKK